MHDEPKRLRAAQYIRMSTEHQNFSTANQVRAIAAYAEARNIDVVRTYADEGRSGLVMKGRKALQELLRDAISGIADFDLILVYDVSRWGRFQDADESAHYEFMCRQAGIGVRYAAEPFENDGSPMSAIIKALKRAMAAEYSRELSVKVFAGLTKIIEKGYHSGAPAPYGLRRALVRIGNPRLKRLRRGEVKSLSTDRVVLVPGPDDEVEAVRRVFRWFAEDGITLTEIVERLNAEGRPSPRGGKWAHPTVRHILSNEIYAGRKTWAKTDTKLRTPVKKIDPSKWVRNDLAVVPIIADELFELAQKRTQRSTAGVSNAEVIRNLKALFDREGTLSHALINFEPGLPSGPAIAQRFGSIDGAYRLAGFVPSGSYRYASTSKLMHRLEEEVITTVSMKRHAGGAQHKIVSNRVLEIGDGISVRIKAARPGIDALDGAPMWLTAITMAERGDWTLVIRPNLEMKTIHDFFLIPRWGYVLSRFSTRLTNPAELDALRLSDMASVCEALRSLGPPPLRESARKGLNKYRPLQDYLRAQPTAPLKLSITEIEAIVGTKLPVSARRPCWWQNTTVECFRSSQAKAWMGAGFRAFFRDGIVAFTTNPDIKRSQSTS